MCSRTTLDMPNERSSHTTPTPRGGGLAFVVTFWCGIWFLSPSLSLVVPLAIGSTLIAGISYLDDRYSLSAKIRLLVQITAAILIIYYLNGHLSDLGLRASLNLSSWLILPVLFCMLFSIIWLTNLYNFMDGIDGLAASQGIFVCLAAAIALIFHQGDYTTAQICLLLAATIAGFLVWNGSPARIFMGDVGSCTLGFMFAALALQTLTLFFWFIIMAVFICDATFTLIRRILAKEVWYSAHRSHAYQRLTQRGYSHRQVSFGIVLFNLIVLLPLAWLSFWHPYLAVSATLILCYVIWYKICSTA